MRTNKDTRGKSYFDVFPDQKGQTDVSYNYPETIRAFHLHKNKDETWFCIKGEFKVVIMAEKGKGKDNVGFGKIVYLSKGDKVHIPRNLWHGFQVLGNKEGIMIEYTTEKHDFDNLDDYRKPYNEFDDWEKERK